MGELIGRSPAVDPTEVCIVTSEVTVHRALASPVRAQLLELLRTSGSPLAIGDLADRLDLHRNTVRSHLGILEIAGLIEHETDTPDGPGRPRSLYRLTADAVASDVASEATDEVVDGRPDDAYRLLAVLLAGQVRDDHPDAGRVAEDAAATWSRQAVAGGGQPRPRDATDAVSQLLDALAAWGFETDVDAAPDADLRLTFPRCPFHDVAVTHPEIACAVHRGITRGALEALGGDVELLTLDPADVPSAHGGSGTERIGGCVARLRSVT